MDIVQDAMLKLAHKYADREVSEWGPLFHRIVQNTIMDWHRRQGVRNTWKTLLQVTGFGKNRRSEDSQVDAEVTADNEFVSISSSNRDSPVMRLMNERTLQALDNALHNLPVRQQQAFLLRIWEGLDVEETADAMKCSQGSVKTHLSRAIHTLRVQLEDHRL